MDNVHRISAITLYEEGWRAYFHTGCGGQVYFRDGLLHHNVLNTINSCSVWEALRAYQDEQRKKGVPIKWDWSMVGSLPGQAVYGISRGQYYLIPCVAVNPIYDEDGMIKTMTGQFTNFRWREGYPKHDQLIDKPKHFTDAEVDGLLRMADRALDKL